MSKLIVGINDLKTTHPDIALEWHPTKNNNVTPQDVTAGSGKLIWWQCNKCGHEWCTKIYNRKQNGSGCPVCAGREARVGHNDLATVCPDLVAEWHREKNGELTPQNVLPKSNKKVWWLCGKCGHEWQAIINNRQNGSGCPVCAGREARAGHNDLAAVCPDLVAEWNWERNGELTPQSVLPKSRKKVWWQCGKCGHEWQAVISSRTIGRSCPVCAKKESRSRQKGYIIEK